MRGRGRRLRHALGAAMTALGVAGCGGTSAAVFLQRGDAICAAAAAHVAHLAEPAGRRVAATARAGWVDAYVAEVRDELRRLSALGYPAGQRLALRVAYQRLQAALLRAQRDPGGFHPSMLRELAAPYAVAGLRRCVP